MIVTADEKRRVALPSPAQPGDVFELEKSGNAGFVLTRVQNSERLVRLERKDGYLVAITNRPITQTMARQSIDEFP